MAPAAVARVAAPAGPIPIWSPPGYDVARGMQRLNADNLEELPHYRRQVTRNSPLIFALVYLMDTLRSPDTGNRISFSKFHLDLAESGKNWMREDLGPAEFREAWIAPRGSAKSSWIFKILPIWAMAHGHQQFIMAFSDSGAIARGHLRSIKAELESNPRLRQDFPDLCTPYSSRGRRTADNAELYIAKSGVAISAKGIDSSTLGVKIGDQRPSCILLDDVEPKEANYDASTRKKRLSAIVDAVFPMSLNAVVQWAATVTASGSLAHDLVKAATGQEVADWIAEQRIRVHYYPAIVADALGNERSLWPQRWTLEYLQSIRGTRTYDLNYNNQPRGRDGTFWMPGHFQYEANFPIAEGVLEIDPAVSNTRMSDYTGYAVVATNAMRSQVCIMDARGLKVSPAGLRATMESTLRRNPWINKVRVEVNQGGNMVAELLRPGLPPGVVLEPYRSTEPKPTRYGSALIHYEDGNVLHACALPAFEEQALAYPNVTHDDILDVVSSGVNYYLGTPI